MFGFSQPSFTRGQNWNNFFLGVPLNMKTKSSRKLVRHITKHHICHSQQHGGGAKVDCLQKEGIFRPPLHSNNDSWYLRQTLRPTFEGLCSERIGLNLTRITFSSCCRKAWRSMRQKGPLWSHISAQETRPRGLRLRKPSKKKGLEKAFQHPRSQNPVPVWRGRCPETGTLDFDVFSKLQNPALSRLRNPHSEFVRWRKPGSSCENPAVGCENPA